MFAPIKPLLSTYQNNRDHRKIVVIDGHTAFTGGINLADEYINEKKRFGYWKDVAVMLKGEAVQNFTIMFLQMWNIWEKKPVPYEPYLYQPCLEGKESFSGEKEQTDGYVLAYGDSPLDHEPVGKKVYLKIFRERMEEKGLLSYADDYFYASGKLAAACYKLELEAALRSANLSGFQLLDMIICSSFGTTSFYVIIF